MEAPALAARITFSTFPPLILQPEPKEPARKSTSAATRVSEVSSCRSGCGHSPELLHDPWPLSEETWHADVVPVFLLFHDPSSLLSSPSHEGPDKRVHCPVRMVRCSLLHLVLLASPPLPSPSLCSLLSCCLLSCALPSPSLPLLSLSLHRSFVPTTILHAILPPHKFLKEQGFLNFARGG